MSDQTPVIAAIGISKWYGTHQVLKSVSLAVRPSEVLVIIGPSGSGKSTLLRCLNFLEEYDHGEVWFGGELVGYRKARNGVLVKDAPRKIAAIRARMGMVFQSFNLFPHMTVLQNVIEGPLMVQRRNRAAVIAEAKALM